MNELYKARLKAQGSYMGETLKNQSDTIMNETFTNDIAYRLCYIDGYSVDAKYIVHTYYSISKDAVDYHLQFRPGVHYPLGTYVDIPDDTNTYNRWLIVGRSDEPQFVKYNILKCNWTLKWIYEEQTYECLCVLRSRNSYNSGLWLDYYTTSPENQTQVWLPTNPITQTIDYNMRFLISDNTDRPIAWEVSKLEDLFPQGILKITLRQSLYNPNVDNKELMIADYYKSNIIPDPKPEEFLPIIMPDLTITYSGKPLVKVCGSYKAFSVNSENFENFDPTKVSWKIVGLNPEDYTTLLNLPVIKIKMSKDYSLIGKVFTLELYYEETLSDSVEIEVVAL